MGLYARVSAAAARGVHRFRDVVARILLEVRGVGPKLNPIYSAQHDCHPINKLPSSVTGLLDVDELGQCALERHGQELVTHRRV